jgi:hypothetical protein
MFDASGGSFTAQSLCALSIAFRNWHMADGPQVCTIVPVAEGVADEECKSLAAGATLLRSKASLRPISREAAYNSPTSQAGGQQRQLTPTPVVRSAGASCSARSPSPAA